MPDARRLMPFFYYIQLIFFRIDTQCALQLTNYQFTILDLFAKFKLLYTFEMFLIVES